MNETIRLENNPFSTKLPTLQLAWDATSLGYFLECPRKYQLSILQKKRKRLTPAPLWWGGLFHLGIEHYLLNLPQGREIALRAAIRRVVTQFQAEEPLLSQDDKKRTSGGLIRALIWYDQRYDIDPLQIEQDASGRPLAELSFRMELPFTAPTGELYLLVGHMDGIARMGVELFVLEHKSTVMSLGKTYFDQYSPDTQVTVYTVASRVVLPEPARGVIINGMQILTSGFRFERMPIYRTAAHLEEWMENLGVWLAFAATCADQNFWPMNDKSCHKWGGCPFRGSCSRSPLVRESYLNTDFSERAWNPLESR